MTQTEERNGQKPGLIFHVSLLYNLCLHHKERRPWWNRIEPHIILGALPFQKHLEMLTKEEGVQAVVTMNEKKELQKNLFGTPITPEDWENANVIQCMGMTGDFLPPSLDVIHRCVNFIIEHVEKKETVYVHCKAGRGRSTVIVCAYLMQHRGLSVDDAIALVKSKRSHVSLHPKQHRILEAFAEELTMKSTTVYQEKNS